MTLEEIRSELAALRAAKRQRLLGGGVVSSSYPETGSITFAQSSLSELNREIARLEIEEARLLGWPSGFAPVVPGFGPRA